MKSKAACPPPKKAAPKAPAKRVEHEAHAYDWRSRNNLKRGRG
jgi:hypothetical protein